MILLTGGAGFIGSHVLKALNERGVTDILIVDNIGETQKWKYLVGRQFTNYVPARQFYAGIERLPTPDVIVHLGARTDVHELDIDSHWHWNTKLSNKLIYQLAHCHSIPYLWASSAAIYGDGSAGFDDNTPIDQLTPRSPYAITKHIADRMALALVDQMEVCVGFRFLNVYGPNEGHKGSSASVVYQWLTRDMALESIDLFKSSAPDVADGDQRRDFIHVDNVAEIIAELVARNDYPANGVYNIGTGRARTFNDVAAQVFKARGIDPTVPRTATATPWIQYVEKPDKFATAFQDFTKAPMRKLRDALRALREKRELPRLLSLERGIRETADVLRERGELGTVPLASQKKPAADEAWAKEVLQARRFHARDI